MSIIERLMQNPKLMSRVVDAVSNMLESWFRKYEVELINYGVTTEKVFKNSSNKRKVIIVVECGRPELLIHDLNRLMEQMKEVAEEV